MNYNTIKRNYRKTVFPSHLIGSLVVLYFIFQWDKIQKYTSFHWTQHKIIPIYLTRLELID